MRRLVYGRLSKHNDARIIYHKSLLAAVLSWSRILQAIYRCLYYLIRKKVISYTLLQSVLQENLKNVSRKCKLCLDGSLASRGAGVMILRHYGHDDRPKTCMGVAAAHP